ncbi:hypothetical protein A0H81_03706 [Grifola frondosa]|uniref:Uncharacterized protein n=1 Tax=Grifola frondosa TaxID=5627 RepID=A0A1C7MI73_GRIFR|nr:hypothetical protein A0H81_03706 [Grifola frondosa]
MHYYPMEEDMADIQDLDWETVLEDLQENTMFTYALRDIQGSHFMINMINFYMADTTVTITQTADITSTAEVLIHNGYLRSTPISPTLAISLSMLELL